MDIFNLAYLIFIGVIALIIVTIWRKIQEKSPKERKKEISQMAAFFAVLLTVGAIFLFDRIWQDLGDLSKDSLTQLFIHTAYAIPLLILALVLYSLFYKQGKEYIVLLIPYFIATSWEFIKLLMDAGNYAVKNLGKLGIYVVLIVIIAFLSVLVFVVQKKWQQYQQEKQEEQNIKL